MNRGIYFVAALLFAGVAATEPAPGKIERNSRALEFSYEWAADAAAIPALDRWMKAQANAELGKAQKYAREDQALARQQKRDYNQHTFAAEWESVGQSPRLLSLKGNFGSFTGGAHPNYTFKALLWDRKLARQIRLESIFMRAGDLPGLTRAGYCKALDAERSKKREGEKLGGDFDQCPSYSELAIFPIDGDGDGKFDSIDLIAPPYVAGPYVEGEYDIVVPVAAKLIAALKPEYRGSFEAQRQ